MTLLKLYSELAEYYYYIEKTSRNFKQEIQFLDLLFRSYRIKKFIDLGCGTGEHLEILRRLGYEGLGLDNSSAMLEVARKRFPASNFHLADMRNFQVDLSYDALICLFGTFNYLRTDEEIQSTLNFISKALKPRGVFILEVWNSIPLMKIRKKPITPVNVCLVGNKVLKRNRGFRISNESKKENLVEVNFLFDLDSKIIKDCHVMRVFSKEEIESFLESYHFEIINIYKDYSRRKFTNKSVRMLFICQKEK